MLKPLGLRNSGNDCWINSLFQCVVWNNVLRVRLYRYLSPSIEHANVWRRALSQYRQEAIVAEPGAISSISTYSLRASLNLDGHGQEDADEGLKQLLRLLPDDVGPLFCTKHSTTMLDKLRLCRPQEDQIPVCQAEGCARVASYGFNVDWVTPTKILRVLRPTDVASVPIRDEATKAQYTQTKPFVGRRGAASRDMVLLPAPRPDPVMLIGLEFPKSNPTRSILAPHQSTTMDEMLDRFMCRVIDKQDQDVVRAIDLKGDLQSFSCVGEQTELCLINHSAVPPLIVFHIGRFMWDKRDMVTSMFSNRQRRSKNQSCIDMDFYINMMEYFDSDSVTQQGLVEHDFEYQLKSFVVHLGANAESGHYIAYLTVDGSTWFLCNDKSVGEVALEAVKEALQHSYLCFFDHVTL